MCVPSGGGGPTPRQLRRQEKERRETIRGGIGGIDSAFAGFGPDFYKARGKSFVDFYLPQLEAQAKNARADAVFDLGRSGLLDSSVGAKRFSDVQGAYDEGRKGVLEGGRRYEQQVRQDIENQRSALARDVVVSGGLLSGSQGAELAAQTATLPPAFSPLADLFGNFSKGAVTNALLTSSGYAGNPFYNAALSLFPGFKTPKPTVQTIGS